MGSENNRSEKREANFRELYLHTINLPPFSMVSVRRVMPLGWRLSPSLTYRECEESHTIGLVSKSMSDLWGARGEPCRRPSL